MTNYDSSIMDHVDTETDSLTENEERVVKDIKISTRRKLGTGYFNNSSKSFADMFKENFELSGFDMNCLVKNYSKDYCFVFNVSCCSYLFPVLMSIFVGKAKLFENRS